MIEIKLHLSGYDLIYDGEVIYFGIMIDATDDEKMVNAEKKRDEILADGVEKYITSKPLPEMNKVDEAILNTNTNVEYLVALKELEV